ncbi:UDP-N-acetylmuramoyl-L-alanyl-D-glutamate--2,6-diaminopimelate ligase MurE [Peptoclostridium acidaminophilum DSM 3953]|uniref:UDP-N-acetylmuramoyl-L-alanyl-D-glutamate--2,6-diaminopimelate ligase n=1 Tax=Peptoclostridium acidaminophilum DSM 3953 TaxID=1286171 RepID=W8U5Y6_PEPAC|nr:UDP-N-acetylmuramoyl-L-alanyl-D-glutamate--2,6-diaminopimelate ligase [Peptoclostridium acidaminophilum]AHM56341.1 UDP-N-acetylmuramoyl-L-alanyl-D-glutamate--2,6-diaminopimelate ligase MurE [Peptoclostridium acidaminophilum DSM 3953]
MKLSDMLSGAQIVSVSGDFETEVGSITYDSRKAGKGSLFICIKGLASDGHDYAKSAYDSGCRAFLAERELELEDACVAVVEDSRREMARAADNFYGNPSKRLDLVGVTGTNGKTTTTYLIKSALDHLGRACGLIGTIRTYTGRVDAESERTTPESIELHSHFSDMLSCGIGSCAMEVSSHSLELHRVDFCDFKYSVFTNLTQDHLDFHPDLESYMKAKEKLFYMTSKANIINIDDKHGKALYERLKALETPCVSYGIKEEADVSAKDISMDASGTSYTMVTPDFECNIEVAIPGEFTVYNTLAAASVLYLMGIGGADISSAMNSCSGVPGRFESIAGKNGVTVIVDYAHTPDALENILKTARGIAKGRVITVFGCGGDRDKTKRPIMGEISQRLSDFSVITSDNPRTEEPQMIIEDIVAGLDAQKGAFTVVVDRKEAIGTAIKMAGPHDIVIVAGKGHEDYQIIGKQKIHFDDKEVARAYLEEGK